MKYSLDISPKGMIITNQTHQLLFNEQGFQVYEIDQHNLIVQSTEDEVAFLRNKIASVMNMIFSMVHKGNPHQYDLHDLNAELNRVQE